MIAYYTEMIRAYTVTGKSEYLEVMFGPGLDAGWEQQRRNLVERFGVTTNGWLDPSKYDYSASFDHARVRTTPDGTWVDGVETTETVGGQTHHYHHNFQVGVYTKSRNEPAGWPDKRLGIITYHGNGNLYPN